MGPDLSRISQLCSISNLFVRLCLVSLILHLLLLTSLGQEQKQVGAGVKSANESGIWHTRRVQLPRDIAYDLLERMDIPPSEWIGLAFQDRSVLRLDRIGPSGKIYDSQALRLPFEVLKEIVRADIDGDGIRDLILVSKDGSALFIIAYRGDDVWFRDVVKIDPVPKSYRLLSGDITGNGLEDLAILRAGEETATLQVLVSNGNRFYAFPEVEYPRSDALSGIHMIEAQKRRLGRIVSFGSVAGTLAVSDHQYIGEGAWESKRHQLSGFKGELINSAVSESTDGRISATIVFKDKKDLFAGRLELEANDPPRAIEKVLLGHVDLATEVFVLDVTGDNIPDVLKAATANEKVILTTDYSLDEGLKTASEALLIESGNDADARFLHWDSDESLGSEIGLWLRGDDTTGLSSIYVLSASKKPKLWTARPPIVGRLLKELSSGTDDFFSFLKSSYEDPPLRNVENEQVRSQCVALGYTVPFEYTESGHDDGAFLEESTYEIPLCFECAQGIGNCSWAFEPSPSSFLTISPPSVRELGPGLTFPFDFDFSFGSVERDTSVQVVVLYGRNQGDMLPTDQVQLRIKNVEPPPPPAGPILTVTPQVIDFGDISSDSASGYFRVSNTGTGVDLEFRATLQGSPFSLGLGDSVFDTLSPGEDRSVSVDFFNIRSSVERHCPMDPSDQNYRICTATVRVSGAGMLEEVELRARVPKRSHLEVANIDARTMNEIDFDLGQVPPNGIRSRDLLLANRGGITSLYVEAHLDMSLSVEDRDPWRIDRSAPNSCGSLLGLTLDPGESCIVRFQFDSTGKRIGNRDFVFRWEFRSGRETGDLGVVLRARTEPSPHLEIVEDPGPEPTIDFGRIAEADERDGEFTIINKGDPGSRLTGEISLDPSTSYSLVEPSNRSFDLGATETVKFQVRYSPQNYSSHTSRIRISHNDLLYTGPDHVKLRGEATAFRLTVRSFVPAPVFRDRVSGTCFLGDGAGPGAGGGGFRTFQVYYFDLIDGTQLPMVGMPPTGAFQQISCGTFGIPGAPSQPLTIGAPEILDPGCLQQSRILLPTNIVSQFSANCEYPLATALENSNHLFTIEVDKQSKNVSISGQHDGWPAYEIIGDFNGSRSVLYEYLPPSGVNEDNLGGPMDVSVSR